MSNPYQISPAVEARPAVLEEILAWNAFMHRHLDWRSPTDWLGRDPYLLLTRSSSTPPSVQPLAVLACPADPVAVAWIRVFAFSPVSIHPQEAWQILWEAARTELQSMPEVRVAAAVVADMPWLEEAMQTSGFQCTHNVIGFYWREKTLPPEVPAAGVQIRAMTVVDLEAVTRLDEAAFSMLWHYSSETLLLAYRNAVNSAVAVDESGEIVGYQVSMRSDEGAHLSRLAVHPARQAGGIGYALTRAMLAHFYNRGIFSITVNTQDNNTASQRLYQKMGFRSEDSAYPVYEYPLREVGR